MLKIFFWLLLIINASLFALEHGVLNGTGFIKSGREPARLVNQLQADNIKLLSEEQTKTATTSPSTTNNPDAAMDSPAKVSATETPAPAPEPAPAPIVPTAFACMEIGNFSAPEARRFASQLAESAPSIKPVRRMVQEIASYRVYLPSLGSQDAANKKGEELLGMGINDFFVIQGAPPLLYGISLGTFKSEEASRTQLARLEEKGLTGMKVEARKATFGKVAFQLAEVDAQTKPRLEKIVASFARKEVRSCDEAPLSEKN
ncbi:SPOR domain-containing protein [Glaciimonas sp. PAMC28666]|uniref:SPOR domain-containing protein n=1 Tax=Glaciimonas sp. PAMC28666 TaxID=2807626 RepID=UPI001964F72B|nr:SPOR domain-containing protein [Glaciimonas sp. PAMC28666]QRX84105.1 SPOR domain-containing protein [Glaciimonas sp. PAMC28666]